MDFRNTLPGRRSFLGSLGLAPFFMTRGAFAQELTETPSVTEGPFYPDKMPLDTDNDLLMINDSITPAVGEITLLSGRVLKPSGEPVRNAFVEIWQCDANGSYRHSKGTIPTADTNFQGYGRFMTDLKGGYFFRTIKPVAYTLSNVPRSPHIHIAVSTNGRRVLTTQIGILGDPLNANDLVLRGLDSKTLSTLMINFPPFPGSNIGELTANFDLVLGRTAFENEEGKLRGTIGKPEGFQGL